MLRLGEPAGQTLGGFVGPASVEPKQLEVALEVKPPQRLEIVASGGQACLGVGGGGIEAEAQLLPHFPRPDPDRRQANEQGEDGTATSARNKRAEEHAIPPHPRTPRAAAANDPAGAFNTSARRLKAKENPDYALYSAGLMWYKS